MKYGAPSSPAFNHPVPPLVLLLSMVHRASLRQPWPSENLAGAAAAGSWCPKALTKLLSTVCSVSNKGERPLLISRAALWNQQLDSKSTSLLRKWPFSHPREKIPKYTEGGIFQPEAQLIAMVRLQAVAFGHKKGLSLKLTCSPLPLGLKLVCFFVFQCYLLHSCILDLRKYSYSDQDWLCMACYFSRI